MSAASVLAGNIHALSWCGTAFDAGDPMLQVNWATVEHRMYTAPLPVMSYGTSALSQRDILTRVL